MDNKDRLQKYIDGLSPIELTEFIKKTAQSLHNTRNRLDNAIRKDGEKGTNYSRAKSSTLYANIAKLHDDYLGLMEMLKQAIKNLV